ncbi:hypothetical protein K438DRAFT_1975467 [Mycena galopus ATCC 62051]|nr:hypothetical protein K438DRAFT_1975467 [Mycena galopus ATCC 62051]
MTVSHFGRISPPSLRINFELPSLRANCEAPPLLPLRVSCDARSVYAYKDADAKLRTSVLYKLRRRQCRCRSSACRGLGRSRTMKETELESEPRTPVPSDFERKMTPVPSLCVSDPANSSWPLHRV